MWKWPKETKKKKSSREGVDCNFLYIISRILNLVRLFVVVFLESCGTSIYG